MLIDLLIKLISIAAFRSILLPFERYGCPKNCIHKHLTFSHAYFFKKLTEIVNKHQKPKYFLKSQICFLNGIQYHIFRTSASTIGWLQVWLKHSYTNFKKTVCSKKYPNSTLMLSGMSVICGQQCFLNSSCLSQWLLHICYHLAIWRFENVAVLLDKNRIRARFSL